MKIAYFSPFSPDRSGISDFSEELVFELAKWCQVDLYAGKPVASEKIKQEFRVYPACDIDRTDIRKQYDHLIYQVGNNRDYHKTVIDTLLKYPGILELHDFSLHHYLAEDTFVQKDFDGYLRIMKYCHGREGERTAKRFLKGEIRAPWEDQSAKYTVNKHLIDQARAVIVHSDMAKQMVKGIRPQAPVINIPLHTTDIRKDYRRYTAACRQSLGIKEPLIFGSFGYATSAKRIEPIIRALAGLKQDGLKGFQYLIVGKVENVPVDQLKKQYDLEKEILVTGYTTIDQFKLYMGACDICFNLRYPTQGESSASLHRMLGLGKAVLVTSIGSFEEYPDDVVIKIGHGASETDEIAEAVSRLIKERDYLARRQEAAYRYAARHLDLKKNARIYYDFFQQLTEGTYADVYEDHLLDVLDSLGLMDEMYALRLTDRIRDWYEAHF